MKNNMDFKRERKMKALKIGMVFLLGMVLAGAGLFAAGGQPKPSDAAPSGPPSGTIVVYTSVPQNLIDEYTTEFRKHLPDITVEVYRAATGDIMAKLSAERQARAPSADVVWLADGASAVMLKNQGLLARFVSSEDAYIPASMKDKDYNFYGSRVINMVLAYNTQAIQTKPTSWNDLLNPAYRGKIGIPNVTSGTSYAFVGNLVAHPDFKWKFFEDMRANGGMRVAANADAVRSLATGEFVLTIVLDYMIKEARDNGSPVDYVIPKEGAVVVVSPIGLTSVSRNPNAAGAFINYVLSAEGMAMLHKQGVVTARSDIKPPPGVPLVQDIHAFPEDSDFLNNSFEEIYRRFEEIFGR